MRLADQCTINSSMSDGDDSSVWIVTTVEAECINRFEEAKPRPVSLVPRY